MTKRKPNPAQLFFDFDGAAPEPWTPERLCEVLLGIGVKTSPWVLMDLNGGTLQDPSVPYSPRSYAFPVKVQIVEGAVRLWLRTPAAGTLPFVGRVEAALGVRALWDEDRISSLDARWHHPIDLISDGRWREILTSRGHTEDRMIVRAVDLGLEWGKLKPAEAREILVALGIEEPSDRSDAYLFGPDGLRPCPSVCAPNLHPKTLVQGWGMVHAMEDGWVAIVRKNMKVTAAYWQRVGRRIAA